MKNYDEIKKLTYDLKLNEERTKSYELISKMAIMAYDREIKMIIENPYST